MTDPIPQLHFPFGSVDDEGFTLALSDDVIEWPFFYVLYVRTPRRPNDTFSFDEVFGRYLDYGGDTLHFLFDYRRPRAETNYHF